MLSNAFSCLIELSGSLCWCHIELVCLLKTLKEDSRHELVSFIRLKICFKVDFNFPSAVFNLNKVFLTMREEKLKKQILPEKLR